MSACPAHVLTFAERTRRSLMIYRRITRRDPTRTTAIRRRFANEVKRRFNEFAAIIVKAIVVDDCFGLAPSPFRRLILQAAVTSPGPRAFAFERNTDKIREFMKWLGKQEDAGILETSHALQLGEGIESAWTNQYIDSAYQQGITRARQELAKGKKLKKGKVPSLESSGGIRAVFNGPMHADRVGVIYTRTFTDLQGITNAMDRKISQLLSEGLVNGLNPREIARNLVKDVKLSEGRAERLARTEVINAHHQGMMQEYKNWGVVGVKVMAEWVTAEDDRVCEDCADLEGKVFPIEEIERMIPLHPNCRCVAIPVDVTD